MSMVFAQTKANCACGGGCPRCHEPSGATARATLPGIGAVVVGGVGNALEREADRLADAATPSSVRAETSRSTAPLAASRSGGDSRIARALGGPGQPLPPTLRERLEPRLGGDFSGVRVHTGPHAAQAARALGARAFTIGSDVAFGSGAFRPATPDGQRLVAHELAHVLQNRSHPARYGPPIVRREAGEVPAPARSFDDLWTEFLRVPTGGASADTLALAGQLVRIMNAEQARQYAVPLTLWLLDQQPWELAAQALRRLDTGITMAWLSDSLVQSALAARRRPETLIRRARDEARRGRHEQASQLFGVAFLLVQMLLDERSRARHRVLAARERPILEAYQRPGLTGSSPTHLAFLTFALNPPEYGELGRLYGLMREILGFYPGEQRAALIAGDRARARAMSGLGLVLRMELREQYSLGATRAITMESVAAHGAQGERGFELYGAGGASGEVVTPLPGTTPLAEMGLFPSFTSPMVSSPRRPEPDEIVESITSGRMRQLARMLPETGLLEAIGGQEDFVTSLYEHDEIRRAFPSTTPIDMDDRAQRVRVWQVMHEVYRRTDPTGLGGINSLMGLIGRYLRVFTRHTEYSLRDYGVSYMEREMPRDFTGRVVRDCGVYALTVAHELYLASRGAASPMNLSFHLFAMPSHVALVVFDLDRDEHYVVNNDRVSAARRPREPRGVPEHCSRLHRRARMGAPRHTRATSRAGDDRDGPSRVPPPSLAALPGNLAVGPATGHRGAGSRHRLPALPRALDFLRPQQRAPAAGTRRTQPGARPSRRHGSTRARRPVSPGPVPHRT